MLSLSEARDASNEYSGKASELARQLGFAALGIIWIFKKDQPGGEIDIAPALIRAAAAVAVGLAFDFLQYLIGSEVWERLFFHHESKCKDEGETFESYKFTISKWFLRPMSFCYYSKIVSIVVAYCFIITHLVQRLWK
jgi:hypothetical protein